MKNQEQELMWLIEQLTHPHGNMRLKAIDALRERGPRAKPALANLIMRLVDFNPNIRQAAQQALLAIDSDWTSDSVVVTTIPQLVKALGKSPMKEPQWAAGVLAQIGKTAVPELCKALAAENDDVLQVWAARTLGSIGTTAVGAATHLGQALQNSKIHVREAAAKALVELDIASEPALPALLVALSDKHPPVRTAVARCLQRLGPTGNAAIPGLVNLLADQVDDVRDAAIDALATMGNRSCLVLTEILESRINQRSEAFKELFENIIKILGSPNPSIVGHDYEKAHWNLECHLQAAFDKSPERIYEAAAIILGKIGRKAREAIPVLADAAKDNNATLRNNAIHALKRIDPVILKTLKTNNYNDRILKTLEALTLLGTIQNSETTKGFGFAKQRVKKTNGEEKENKQLLNLQVNLQSELKRIVVTQDEAISKVTKALCWSKKYMENLDLPVGCFLFLGPRGVGRTLLAKALAEVVFGSRHSFIRVNMDEFQIKPNITQLVDDSCNFMSYRSDILMRAIHPLPHMVLFLDEIEKAHSDFQSLLLQIMDKGMLTDRLSHSVGVSFKNVILILNSNIGTELFMNQCNFKSGEKTLEVNYEKIKDTIQEEVKHKFYPEFLNRLDETIVFRPLNHNDMKTIVDYELDKVFKHMIEHGPKLNLTDQAKEFLIDKGYSPEFGARPLHQAIEQYIKIPLSKPILEGKFKDKNLIHIDVKEEDNIKFAILDD